MGRNLNRKPVELQALLRLHQQLLQQILLSDEQLLI